MNNSVRMVLQRTYPKCLPLLQARGVRVEYTEDSAKPERGLRDNYTESANKNKEMTKIIKEKINEIGRVVKEVTATAGDQAEKLKEKAKQRTEEATDALKEKDKANERDPRRQ